MGDTQDGNFSSSKVTVWSNSAPDGNVNVGRVSTDSPDVDKQLVLRSLSASPKWLGAAISREK